MRKYDDVPVVIRMRSVDGGFEQVIEYYVTNKHGQSRLEWAYQSYSLYTLDIAEFEYAVSFKRKAQAITYWEKYACDK